MTRSLSAFILILVTLLALDWVLGALITSRVLPSWTFLLANVPLGAVYLWTESLWMGTYYQLRGTPVGEDLVALAQLASVLLQALVYWAAWRWYSARRLRPAPKT